MSAGLGVILAGILGVLLPYLRVRQLEHAFDKVRMNDPRGIVLQDMGKPWRDEECGKYIGGHQDGCVEEFIYAHPYAPYSPEYWVIDFDSSQQVINKVHLISP
jgi:hypothetical protein